MKRANGQLLAAVLITGVIVGVFMILTFDLAERHATTAMPDVQYHASDPALIASTARPQLLEFFHPQ